MKLLAFVFMMVVVVSLSMAEEGLGDSESYRSGRIRRAETVVVPMFPAGAEIHCFEITPEVAAEFTLKHNLSVFTANTKLKFKDQPNEVTIGAPYDMDVFYEFGNSSSNDVGEEVLFGDAPKLTPGGFNYSELTNRSCVRLQVGDVMNMSAALKDGMSDFSTTKGLRNSLTLTKEVSEIFGDPLPVSVGTVINLRANKTLEIPPTIRVFFLRNTTAQKGQAPTTATVAAVNSSSIPVLNGTNAGEEMITARGVKVEDPPSAGPNHTGWIVGSVVVIIALVVGTLVLIRRRNQKAERRSLNRHGAERLNV